MQNIDVIYRGEVLRLTRFWGDNRLCLYATKPSQTDMPKMEFVGGHPDEWCIFIDNLTDDEKDQIVDFEGHSIDIKDISKENKSLEYCLYSVQGFFVVRHEGLEPPTY